MARLIRIGIDIAIIALICGSLFSGGPLIKNGPATATSLTPPATDARAVAETR